MMRTPESIRLMVLGIVMDRVDYGWAKRMPAAEITASWPRRVF